MYKPWVHTEEQQRALDDRYERLQRGKDLDDSWSAVGFARIQEFYQIVKYPGGIIILPYEEKNEKGQQGRDSSHQGCKSNIYLGAYDAYTPWKCGRSDNSSSRITPGKASQPGLRRANWQMIWQNGVQKINYQSILSACKFFGSYPAFTRVYRAPQEPVDPETKNIFGLVTRLPSEVQMMILQALPLHRGDLEVRLYYPHLIPLWIETVSVRFYRKFSRLCSTDNMDYVGRYYRECYNNEGGFEDFVHGIDFYRLKSLDNYPKETSRLRAHLSAPEKEDTDEDGTDEEDIMPPVEESSLRNASQNLIRNLEQLLIYTKARHLKEAYALHGWVTKRDDLVTPSNRVFWSNISEKEGLSCNTCSDELPSRPFLIPLSFTEPLHTLNRRGKTETADQYLLIFEDELAEILKDMEVAYRPQFWQFHESLRNWALDLEQEREIAEWMEYGCYTVELGAAQHDC